MPWYGYSLLTAAAFVGLYLCVKWLTSKGFESRQILLFMIGAAFVGFLGIAAPSLPSVSRSPGLPGFLVAVSFAGICAAIGHWADFEAIKRAPNPGFATAIRNVSILPVTVVSVFLFGSAFHPAKTVGAVLILAGVGAMLVERGASRSGQKGWAALAGIALASYTLMVLGMKQATRLGFAAPEICLAIYVVNLGFFLVVCRRDLGAYARDRGRLRLFLPVAAACAVFAVAANLLNVRGLELAPNPGYHEAIRTSNVLFVTLLAIPLFGASFDGQKMLGVVAIVAGMVILVVA